MYFNSAYERVPATEQSDDHVNPLSPSGSSSPVAPHPSSIPNSPPPSFRSRTSSWRTPSEQHHHHNQEHDRDLDDAFAAPSDDEDDDDNDPDAASSRRLVQDDESQQQNNQQGEDSPIRRPMNRTVTEINMFMPGASGGSGSGSGAAATGAASRTGRVYGGGQSTNDGVFANISAKPTPGEDLEEKPPTYEQAAADATPPYWETTILAPGAFNSDDVFVDGLVVGSLFSFVWNALISMSFQLIGFLLTYLLHTTHAAKHGSRAGLGITLIQYGFTFRAGSSDSPVDTTPGVPGTNDPSGTVPSNPNAHDFDPNAVDGNAGSHHMAMGISTTDWISYALMIVGWFILIRAVSDFIRARRQEEMVRATHDRGLGVAVVAQNEGPETAV